MEFSFMYMAFPFGKERERKPRAVRFIEGFLYIFQPFFHVYKLNSSAPVDLSHGDMLKNIPR